MYYLAIDIGASSGRHILASVTGGKIELKEIYRFKNGAEKKNGSLVWNVKELYANVLNGLKECARLGVTPYSVGIDTWGVDYALLDGNGEVVGDVYSYRDSRTDGIPEKTEEILPFKDLYAKTGIQKCTFNTVYQLCADKLSGKLDKADKFLMVPDLLNYYLTGVMANEYSDASTTALLNAETREWDKSVLSVLGIPEKIFPKLVKPGTVLGKFTDEVKKEVGFDAYVVAVAEHDTASAVMAVPSLDDTPLYISSGTWSLLGTELKKPVTSEKALKFNITNEGGYNDTIRFLKNITGMWTIQSIKKELNDKYGYEDLMNLAISASDIKTVVDLNDKRFLAPDSMIEAVKSYARDKGERVPETVGEVMNVVYNSLATLYADTVKKTEEIVGVKFTSLNIVGGGSKDRYLNELTKKYTGLRVLTGPTEGTAVGNVLCQAISSEEIKDITEARKTVMNSFGIKEI